MAHYALMGMGITGRAVATALIRRNNTVVALDDRINDDLLSWANVQGIEVQSPGDVDVVALLKTTEALIPAPGLPDHHPIFAAATEAGIEVMSEFDLAASWDDRPIVAVTGTDGKTTVVTLIERMLERSGIATIAVGNTDTPYVDAIDNPDYKVFVVEASSFRLGYSQRFSPEVGAWLNFGPDHLDAHVSIEAYEQAKATIWTDRVDGMLAVANRDDDVVSRYAAQITDADVQTFGSGEPPTPNDHGILDGSLIVSGASLVAIDELQRAMPHDLLNALAASACALRVGATRDAAAAVIREFTGLPHRVEHIGEIDGVQFVNDSKATTPHAAAAALGGFDSIVLLAGGKNKGLSFDDMLEHSDRIRHVVALGECAADIEAVFAGHAPTTVATSMEQAIAQAREVANAGDVVLLSPACASYDWYKSYVRRGEDFSRIVRSQMMVGESV